jgi:hypothetical protein
MKKVIFIIYLLIIFSSCQQKSTSENTTQKQKDYNNLAFGNIPPTVINGFILNEKDENVLVEPGYYVWGMSVIKWDGEYHSYYSRWNKKHGFDGWMTHCEIAHAKSLRPEGPFEFVNVVLESRNNSGWDLLNAHNPYAVVVDGQIMLYYISNDLRSYISTNNSEIVYPDSTWLIENRDIIRNSQRIGLAKASEPGGPFTRSKEPVVEPDGVNYKNIAVNPAVAYSNNRYIMIMKSDDIKHDTKFRIQFAGYSDNAEGPFVFPSTSLYDEKQTEDAYLWYDKLLNSYYMICHVMGQKDLAFFKSDDGLKWNKHERAVFMKKEILLSNDSLWIPDRVERPFILTDSLGQPMMIYVAVADKNTSGNIAIPIHY